MTSPVVVSGMGCLCAAGMSVREAVASIYDARRAPAPSRRVPLDLDKAYPVFEIASDLDDELAELDGAADFGGVAFDTEPTRTSRLALLAAVEALREAGLRRSDLAGMRVGVAMGTTVGCTLNNEPFYRAWRAGENPDLGAIDRFLGNNPAKFSGQDPGRCGACRHDQQRVLFGCRRNRARARLACLGTLRHRHRRRRR